MGVKKARLAQNSLAHGYLDFPEGAAVHPPNEKLPITHTMRIEGNDTLLYATTLICVIV